MMGKNVLLATLFTGAVAFAQMGPPPGPGGYGRGFGPEGHEFGMRPGAPVTGAPYSADVSDTVVETLSDGNVIQRSTTGKVARDSAGRIYSQETITGGMLAQHGPATITFIHDPVAGYSYMLDATTKTAMRRALKAPPAAAATSSRPERPTPPDMVVTDLGTQTVNGVSAEGKSRTRTIPAGAEGNAQPMVSTSETWFSPDLKIVVSATRKDPRTGQSTYTLTNIKKGEPDETLFQVPAGYTVKDAPAGHGPGGPPPPGE